jgi:hypothetical protein
MCSNVVYMCLVHVLIAKNIKISTYIHKQASRASKETINTGSSSKVHKLQACGFGLEAVRQGKNSLK